MFTFEQSNLASFDHPIEMLLACHEKIRKQCDTLEKMLAYLADKGYDNQVRKAAEGVLRYFDTAGNFHHQDEEQDLFPLLMQFAPAQPLLVDLLQQHEQMMIAWQTLRQNLLNLIQSDFSKEKTLSTEIVSHFVQLYRQHIIQENEKLLPLAQQHLNVEQLQQLGQKMAKRRTAS